MDTNKVILLVDTLETQLKEIVEALVLNDVKMALEKLQVARVEMAALRRFVEQESSDHFTR